MERFEDWPRVKDIFAAAIALTPDARSEYVLDTCGDDEELRAQVLRLIAAHDQAASFLESPATAATTAIPERIGRYRVIGKLGEGGMGLVYDAFDERLGRRVALKVIHRDLINRPGIRERFHREARVAAGVNHPRVCQIYDIADQADLVFLTMERLEGESLAERLRRGPLRVSEAVNVCLGVLDALETLHRHGIVHRDVKPSNVFLTPQGIKLLDFGLARSTGNAVETHAPLTAAAVIVGTPRYMAPEQIQSAAVDERSDIFAVSAILYEMLTGAPAFDADSLPAILDKILRVDPPMIAGAPAITAADTVIRRGLAKRPRDRYPTAARMAEDLRAVLLRPDDDRARPAVAVTRLIVLPFRLLKPDSEIDFLPFGLADAVASSLSAIGTLVVRSSLVAARFSGDVPDLKAIAEGASVDVVLSGTLIRAGARLRVAVQLVEAPGGRVIWSETSQLDVGDVFQLQDDLTQRIVESLALPLSGREQRALARNVPASAQAYEFYLRGNQLSRDPQSVDLAREMYVQAVEADPKYAPAWARLGHLYRVIGKYRADRESMSRAESALNRALEVNPDLSFADRVYAQIEVDYGRGQEAMVRLLRRVSIRANDPDLFAGLVHSCRYCGLFEASVMAHERAQRLDPHVRTSLQYTLLMAGHYDRAIAEAGGYDSVRGMALAMIGDPGAAAELRSQAQRLRAVNMGPTADFCDGVAAMADGDAAPLRVAVDAWITAGLRDPEALFIHGLLLAGGGDDDRGLELMIESTRRGYLPYDTLACHRWLDSLRGRTEFTEMLDTTRTRHEQAVAAFHAEGGLGI